ncbi:MAM (Meprin, A5-protein, PTPmu) domain protein [Ditylenchus destructor]|uniref:MAM (Meprin, A5-protein, PTPmu) domain protein n=1 Tax=Ditylenchus destructor TaxID=166010 RepID=A0AAD4R375_9BILA|nr:MAM (Meprin, A5-protein, PTPmu) domain protein [Ditylenchus destructor]
MKLPHNSSVWILYLGESQILVFVAILCNAITTECCAPPLPADPTQANPGSVVRMSPSTTARVFGEQTQAAGGSPIQIEKANSIGGRVVVPEPYELYCADFDDKCRWRNMEGLLVDELDWYQGAGFLDEARLRLATGTHVAPDGYYGIAATDKIEFPTSKAVLVSDIIECQSGTAELRFAYWTSPEVRIFVCIKNVLKLYPDYDYCAPPVENGDPGPARVSLPDLNGQAFQIYLRAENFVFHTANLQGGFAIIDNIEYEGNFCRNSEDGQDAMAATLSKQILPSHTPLLPQPFGPIQPAPLPQPNHAHVFLNNDQEVPIESTTGSKRSTMTLSSLETTTAVPTPLPWSLTGPIIVGNHRIEDPKQKEESLKEAPMSSLGLDQMQSSQLNPEGRPFFMSPEQQWNHMFPLLQLGQSTRKLTPAAVSSSATTPSMVQGGNWPQQMEQFHHHLYPSMNHSPTYASPNYLNRVGPGMQEAYRLDSRQYSPVKDENKPQKHPQKLLDHMNMEACYALNCSFDDHCAEYVLQKHSEWQLSRKPVGNPLTGIRGDASQLPYNKEGTFVFVVGPKSVARFSTRSFTLMKNAYLMFAYHKVARKTNLRMLVKRAHGEKEEILFELAFEVENLPPNAYIGIDELVLLDDETREPLCQNLTNVESANDSFYITTTTPSESLQPFDDLMKKM